MTGRRLSAARMRRVELGRCSDAIQSVLPIPSGLRRSLSDLLVARLAALRRSTTVAERLRVEGKTALCVSRPPPAPQPLRSAVLRHLSPPSPLTKIPPRASASRSDQIEAVANATAEQHERDAFHEATSRASSRTTHSDPPCFVF